MSWKKPYKKSMALCAYIDCGRRRPEDVAALWHDAFLGVAKHLGFNGKARRILWDELALGNWNHLHPTKDEQRWTPEEWLGELRADVFYCSDRWSLDRLTRCHWLYRMYARSLSNASDLGGVE